MFLELVNEDRCTADFPTLFNIVWSPYYPWKFESGVKSSIGNLLKSLWKLLDESQEVKGLLGPVTK